MRKFRTRHLMLVALVLLGLVAGIAAQNQTAAGLLDEGNRTIRSKGVEAGIAIYERLVREFPNDQPNVAKALVQLCKQYDLIGETENARKNCQEAVSRFSGQAEAVAEARRVLAGLPPPRQGEGVFVAEMDARSGAVREVRLLSEPAHRCEYNPSWSPDPNVIAFRRSNNCLGAQTVVVVRNLETKAEQTWSSSPCQTAIASHSMWFPDGKGLLTITRSNPIGTSCVLRNDLEKGLAAELLFKAISDLTGNYAAFSPDGRMLYGDHGSTAAAARSSVVTLVSAYDLATKQMKQIYVLPALTGQTTFTDQDAPANMAVSPDGRTIAHIRWADSVDAHLVRYDVDGPELKNYRDLLSGVGRMRAPAWSRDGGRILFASSPGPDTWRIMQIPAEGGAARFTGLEVTTLRHFDLSPDGSRIVFDGKGYKLSPPDSYSLKPVPQNAASGSMAPRVQMTVFNREGQMLRKVGDPVPLTGNIAVSPNGRSIARGVPGDGIYLHDIASDSVTKLLADSGMSTPLFWSSDNARIGFQSTRSGKGWGVYAIAANGSGAVDLVYEPIPNFNGASWSLDGRFIVFHGDGGPGYFKDLWVLPVAQGAKPQSLLHTLAMDVDVRLSPDGRYIAYRSDVSRREELYVRPFDPKAELETASASAPPALKISTAGSAGAARWRRDGKVLYFLALNGDVMAVDVNTTAAAFEAGRPRVLFTAPREFQTVGYTPGQFFDVSADGQVFALMIPVR